MDPRRTNPHAQPEIHFAGSLDASISRVSDPAVTAAFVRFHRQTSRVLPQAARKGYVSRTGLALGALALLGFGGGLSLAFFSFNSPERSGSAVASRPPEIIYTAPARSEAAAIAPEAPVYSADGELALFAHSAFELRAEDQPVPETSIWREADATRFTSFGTSDAAQGAPTFALAGQQGSGASTLGAPAADVTSDFGALTAAPVPEPSTWTTMISGAGLLMVFARLKRRAR